MNTRKLAFENITGKGRKVCSLHQLAIWATACNMDKFKFCRLIKG